MLNFKPIRFGDRIGLDEDVFVAGVKFALDAPDNHVAFLGFHSPLERIDQQIPPAIPPIAAILFNPGHDVFTVLTGELYGLDLYGSLNKDCCYHWFLLPF